MGIPLSPSAALVSSLPGSNAAPRKSAGLETPTFQEELAHASTESAKIDEAAKQFEALIVGQILKVSRESSDGGWLGSGEDQGGQMAVELGEQAFAQAIAARGAFGIAKLVKHNLEQGKTEQGKTEQGNSKAASSVPTEPRRIPSNSGSVPAR